MKRPWNAQVSVKGGEDLGGGIINFRAPICIATGDQNSPIRKHSGAMTCPRVIQGRAGEEDVGRGVVNLRGTEERTCRTPEATRDKDEPVRKSRGRLVCTRDK